MMYNTTDNTVGGEVVATEASTAAAGADEDDEIEVICCICNIYRDEGLMIQCDTCQVYKLFIKCICCIILLQRHL